MKGTITRRGKGSWRLKFDIGRDANGNRQIRYQTVRGKRQDAEKELTRQLNALHDGVLVDPSKITVAEHLRTWLDAANVTPKTLERYCQLAERQIIPHLGHLVLQKLRPAHIQQWHAALGKSGSANGKPLSARTIGHAHRVLHKALARATATELVSRNVASVIRPPKTEASEIEVLDPTQIADVLTKLKGHELYTLVALALGTGLRRGELLALRWADVDLNGAVLRVERSLEETKAGLRFKTPKTKHGRRAVSLPSSAVEALRAHRRRQLELRLALGSGREPPDALVFSTPEDQPLSPDNLSRDWRRAVKARGLPPVMFHALRHSHASVLIARGVDILTVSRRLGHGSPTVTLTVYAHLIEKVDTKAAAAIEAALKGGTPA
jgi:integrase